MEELITTFFQEIIWNGIIKLGASVRWIFLKKKFTFKQVLEQNWNGRIGLSLVVGVVSLIIWLNN